jgi:DNA-binding CsgD family transcriptional regulator
LPRTNGTEGLSKASVQNDWSALWKPFAEALEELTASLEQSTVGVAFFDQQLRCQALNRAFAAAWSLPPSRFLGKTLLRSVGPRAKKLNGALDRVRSRGSVRSNFHLTGKPFGLGSDGLRSVNFYPVADDTGRVRVIAATFGESSTLERHLANLVSQLQLGLPMAMCLLGASFPEVLARSLQSSTRSIRRLRTSLTPRSPLSGLQVEIGLMPLALYLSLTGSRSVSPLVPMVAASGPISPHEPESDPAALLEDPSPRELQVLRLLAIGQSNKEVGRGLGISTRTVETYRARLIRKLDVHSTAELVRYAIRNKVVEA